MSFWTGSKPSPLAWGVAVSLFLHALLWLKLSGRMGSFRQENQDNVALMEIDLTRPFRLVSDPRLAHRSENPGTGGPVVEKPTPAAGTGQPAEKKERVSALPGPVTQVKEWVLPGPQTQQLEKGTVESGGGGGAAGSGTGAGPGGLGVGEGGGEVDLIYLDDIPRLLNREEFLRNLQRFYPDEERRQDHEGDVGLVVHLDPTGSVRQVGISNSAGPLFDEAAKKVMSLARFSPAKAGGKAVAVKMNQTIRFQLQ